MHHSTFNQQKNLMSEYNLYQNAPISYGSGRNQHFSNDSAWNQQISYGKDSEENIDDYDRDQYLVERVQSNYKS